MTSLLKQFWARVLWYAEVRSARRLFPTALVVRASSPLTANSIITLASGTYKVYRTAPHALYSAADANVADAILVRCDEVDAITPQDTQQQFADWEREQNQRIQRALEIPRTRQPDAQAVMVRDSLQALVTALCHPNDNTWKANAVEQALERAESVLHQTENSHERLG